MSLHHYIIEQLKTHPTTQPQDIVKQCYQAAFGAEHLLKDTDRAKQYLQREYETVTPSNSIPLYEEISETVCRVNLASWKAKQLPIELLFQLFVQSCTISTNGNELFLQYLQEATDIIQTEAVPFSFEQWNNFLQEYKAIGMPSLHHSETYHNQEVPAYRIVKKEWINLLPILEKINEITTKKSYGVIAIDGKAGAGKTTLAHKLSQFLNAELIAMDDFFLPMQLRTKERLQSAGGNVHYERFLEQVIPYLHSHRPFIYQIFDCSIMDYNKEKSINNTGWTIVEGSYSHHPLFQHYADITIFVDITKDVQMKRILQRNGEKMAHLFETKWIPMEEHYFQQFQIKENSDFIINNSLTTF